MNIEDFKSLELSRKTQRTEREALLLWLETQDLAVEDIRFGNDNPKPGVPKEPDLIIQLKGEKLRGAVLGFEVREVYKDKDQALAYNLNLERTSELESTPEEFGQAVRSAVEDKLSKHYDRDNLDQFMLLIVNRDWLVAEDTADADGELPVVHAEEIKRHTNGLTSDTIDLAFLVNFVGELKSILLNLNNWKVS